MKKLLIISPHFPPLNTPDLHRVRTAIPYLVEQGVEITVLAVAEDEVAAPKDMDLLHTMPGTIRVIRVNPFPLSISKIFGLQGIALRSLFALWKAGKKLLEQEAFDVAYFSTTVFLATILGPYWKKRYHLPYVLDYQDPWINTYYQQAKVKPPGGYLKFTAAQFLARTFEPRVVQQSAHITAVSEDYIPLLLNRYNDLTADRISYLPFGAAEKDFALLRQLKRKNHLEEFSQKKHIVYVGRVGTDMQQQLENFFQQLATFKQQHPLECQDLLCSFWGTSYSSKEDQHKIVVDIAEKYGLQSLVYEKAERIPYFEALTLLSNADALLLLASDDTMYSPSKIYPYLLAHKPLVLLKNSSDGLSKLMKETNVAHLFTVDERSGLDDALHLICGANESKNLKNDIDPEITAANMSKKLHTLFMRVAESFH